MLAVARNRGNADIAKAIKEPSAHNTFAIMAMVIMDILVKYFLMVLMTLLFILLAFFLA